MSVAMEMLEEIATQIKAAQPSYSVVLMAARGTNRSSQINLTWDGGDINSDAQSLSQDGVWAIGVQGVGVGATGVAAALAASDLLEGARAALLGFEPSGGYLLVLDSDGGCKVTSTTSEKAVAIWQYNYTLQARI